MKLKNDVAAWREEIKEVAKQAKVITTNQAVQTQEIKVLAEQIAKLVKTTETVADSIIALLSQQIGD